MNEFAVALKAAHIKMVFVFDNGQSTPESDAKWIERRKREIRAAMLVQARYRGNVGRFLLQVRRGVDARTYDELVARRSQMVQRQTVRAMPPQKRPRRTPRCLHYPRRWFSRSASTNAWLTS